MVFYVDGRLFIPESVKIREKKRFEWTIMKTLIKMRAICQKLTLQVVFALI
ncbi:hypothetical protein EDC54_106167 [Samsonia erythrinae]|uniref:Uncharacterized protein n=1 Tax=Samsonia erythrinae TaxID=160434 RepID=A0A4R3VM80_9GAMM|nr:hypothetical protein EDC54_106167 [Samsonia erythrinae]